jgi:hypothetical protein
MIAALALLVATMTADNLTRAEAALRAGDSARARELANAVIDHTTAHLVTDPRRVLQRATLIRAYSERSRDAAAAEWDWFMAKSFSVSDMEMIIDGVPPMRVESLHASVPLVQPPIVAPVVVSRVAAVYPHAARMMLSQGVVITETVVDEHGMARQPLVLSQRMASKRLSRACLTCKKSSMYATRNARKRGL